MTDHEIVTMLMMTGHLQRPFGVYREVEPRAIQLPLTHPIIEEAVRSYQDFMVAELEPLVLAHHSRPARCDGVTGPATRELFDLPRCGCADYHGNMQPMIGEGSWKGCHDVGDFHAATIFVHEDQIPSFLRPVWEEVWSNAVNAYAALGLRFDRTRNKAAANIDMSFVRKAPGWIGLAVVGQGQSCDSQIWCRFLGTYEPKSLVEYWSRLVCHEWAHNAGLGHTRSGIMAPYITPGPASWKGDASETILNRYYGGEPVGGEPEPPDVPQPPTPGDAVPVGSILTMSNGKEFDATWTPRAEG